MGLGGSVLLERLERLDREERVERLERPELRQSLISKPRLDRRVTNARMSNMKGGLLLESNCWIVFLENWVQFRFQFLESFWFLKTGSARE